MRVTLAQLTTTIGDLEGNAQRAVSAITQAYRQGADIVVFPELFLTGYFPKDLLLSPWFQEKTSRILAQLVQQTKRMRNILIIIGVPTMPKKSAGPRQYNSAVVIQNGRVRGYYHKRTLLSTSVGDEHRFFIAGEKYLVVKKGKKRIGIVMEQDVIGDNGKIPSASSNCLPPSRSLDALVVLTAAPFLMGKDRERHTYRSALARQQRTPVMFVNHVGGNDELILEGRSVVYNAKGECIALLSAFEEEIVTVDIGDAPPRPFTPLDPMEGLRRALSRGIRDYVCKTGFHNVIVGLSGGIDSSVVACLAVDALGKDHVTGILLPSEYTSPESIEAARTLAKNLGIRTKLLSIAPLHNAYRERLREFVGTPLPSVVDENVQARIRGVLLMAYANASHSLVLATGNKSEIAMGYCTLYGDTVGAIAPLADVTKTEVYALAHSINKEREVIPRFTLEREPTAELKPNQKDTDSLPPYALLDPLVKEYMEKGKIDMQRAGETDLVQSVVTQIHAAEFKRRQMPIGIVVKHATYTRGWHMPIAMRVPFFS